MSGRRGGLVARALCTLLGGVVSSVVTAGEPTFSPNTPNEYTFDAVSARFVRVVVSRTNQSAVCFTIRERMRHIAEGVLNAVRLGLKAG